MPQTLNLDLAIGSSVDSAIAEARNVMHEAMSVGNEAEKDRARAMAEATDTMEKGMEKLKQKKLEVKGREKLEPASGFIDVPWIKKEDISIVIPDPAASTNGYLAKQGTGVPSGVDLNAIVASPDLGVSGWHY